MHAGKPATQMLLSLSLNLSLLHPGFSIFPLALLLYQQQSRLLGQRDALSGAHTRTHTPYVTMHLSALIPSAVLLIGRTARAHTHSLTLSTRTHSHT